MALVWDKTLYDQVYRLPLWPWGVRNYPRTPYGHYHWFSTQQMMNNTLSLMMKAPGFAQVSDVAIVGGGFGWTCDLLSGLGINAKCVEVSPYILSTMNNSEEQELRDSLTEFGFDPDNLPVLIGPDYNTPVNPWDHWLRGDGRKSTSGIVLSEDLSTNTSRRNVRQALGNNLDAIVSEFVLDSQENEADALVIIERCEQLRSKPATAVIHLVTDGQDDPRFIDYTKEQWRTVLDTNGYNHYIVDVYGNVLAPGG